MQSSKNSISIHVESKHFWRTRETIDFSFVTHSQFDIIEILGFSQLDHTESLSRIYVSASKLALKIENSGHIDENLNSSRDSNKEETSIKREKIPYDAIRSKVKKVLANEYLLSRLQVFRNDEMWKIVLQPQFGDTTIHFHGEERIDIECDIPDNLEPAVIQHSKTTNG